MNRDLVLHLDGGDPAMLRFVARNARNYLNAAPEEKADVVIVANGPGAALCAKPHDESIPVLDALFDLGVAVKVCANALAEQKIPREFVFTGCEIVPAGLAEIVRLQREGYAYVKP